MSEDNKGWGGNSGSEDNAPSPREDRPAPSRSSEDVAPNRSGEDVSSSTPARSTPQKSSSNNKDLDALRRQAEELERKADEREAEALRQRIAEAQRRLRDLGQGPK